MTPATTFAPILRLLSIPNRGGVVYAIYGRCIGEVILSTASGRLEISRSWEGSARLGRAAIDSTGRHLAVSDENKDLLLLSAGDEATGWEVAHKGRLEKSATAICFANKLTSTAVLVADKFGEAHRFSLAEASDSKDGVAKGQTLLGHVSIITDMVVTPDGKQIITADRDEKIRISRVEQPFIIDQFLLEHKEYVSAVACLGDQLLVSTGGDGQLVVWKWTGGGADRKATCHQTIQLAEGSACVDPLAMAVSADSTTLAIIFDQLPLVSLFKLSGCELERIAALRMPSENCWPLAIAFDADGNLFVSTTSCEAAIAVFLAPDMDKMIALARFDELSSASLGVKEDQAALGHHWRGNLRKDRISGVDGDADSG